MKYIIIEDEQIVCKSLQDIVSEVRPEYELVATLESVEESVEYLRQNTPDLILMDIELGDGKCFDILRHVEVRSPIIFTTAYNEYAIEAFRTNGIDYLLKPIMAEDMSRALTKLESMRNIFNSGIYRRLVNRFGGGDSQRILISGNKSFSYVNISDIAFFSVEDRYVVLYTKDGRNEITDIRNMEEAMTLVSEHDFFQLSRSVIAHIDAIKKVRKSDNARLLVSLVAGSHRKDVTISFQRRAEFLAWMGK